MLFLEYIYRSEEKSIISLQNIDMGRILRIESLNNSKQLYYLVWNGHQVVQYHIMHAASICQLQSCSFSMEAAVKLQASKCAGHYTKSRGPNTTESHQQKRGQLSAILLSSKNDNIWRMKSFEMHDPHLCVGKSHGHHMASLSFAMLRAWRITSLSCTFPDLLTAFPVALQCRRKCPNN